MLRKTNLKHWTRIPDGCNCGTGRSTWAILLERQFVDTFKYKKNDFLSVCRFVGFRLYFTKNLRNYTYKISCMIGFWLVLSTNLVIFINCQIYYTMIYSAISLKMSTKPKILSSDQTGET